MEITSLFAVPQNSLGRQPQPEGAVERGELELAEIKRFEGAYPGVRLERSDEAHAVEMDRYLELTGIKQFG